LECFPGERRRLIFCGDGEEEEAMKIREVNPVIPFPMTSLCYGHSIADISRLLLKAIPRKAIPS